MSVLARLRGDLDLIPSPVESQPGLLIRDPMQYSDTILIIPPPLVPYLGLFDGEQPAPDGIEPLRDILSRSGFLDDDAGAQLQNNARRQFAEAPLRLPAHMGSAYPEDLDELRRQMNIWMGTVPRAQSSRQLIGIAAPHVSPAGGYESYRAAYRLLTPEYKDRTFVVLGTSHYGPPDQFGITRKPYVTPFGATRTAGDLVSELNPNEDYSHAVEHSIEFQVLFLQSIYGPDIEVLPILCGSYAHSIYFGGAPEGNDKVKRLLGTLGEMSAREGDRLLWVLGIDLAHMGRRYGDEFVALADRDEMIRVAERDRIRMDRICEGDAAGFWNLVQENRDDLKWCGSAPIYTFMKAVPEARATLERYEQWNIDDQSVVSFAAMQLYKE